MTSLWEYPDGMYPLGVWLYQGLRLMENYPHKGDIQSWYPHGNVMFVLLYQTNFNLVKYADTTNNQMTVA